jgi:hypothetical protein
MDNEDLAFLKELCDKTHNGVIHTVFTDKETVDRILEIHNKYGKEVLNAYIVGVRHGYTRAMSRVQSKLDQFKEAA